MTPAQAVTHFRRAAASVPAAVIAAEQQTVKEGLAAAARLSSGPYSAAQLRAAGSPYARRAPNSAFDAAIVNVQSGRFRAAFRGVSPALMAGIVKSSVVNNSPEAKYMRGTKTMVTRGIGLRVQQTVQPGRIVRLKKVIQSVPKV